MKRLIVPFLTIFCLSASAAVITPEQALMQIERTNQHIRGVKTPSEYRLRHTISDAAHRPAVYAFSQADSYIFLSADDAISPILGYANCDSDADNLPPELSWWLGEYARQIEYLRAHPETALRHEGSRADNRQPIAPLCTTRWNQDDPYNLMCPTNPYTGEKCYTGCMATAMAQLMKYHNWPVRGKGSNTYSTSEIGGTLSCDFSTITFDWNNMLDSYEFSNPTQRYAVAQLMMACGYAQNMCYMSDGSGAWIGDYIPALINNFGYDQGLAYYMRDYFSLTEWEDMIYDNLKNIGPIHMGGGNRAGGHAFVCDGYDRDGYFHINWGWGGYADGYFLLSVLDPADTGIGASSDGGFIFNQDIILNIRPAIAGSKPVAIATTKEMTIEETSARAGDWIKVICDFETNTYGTHNIVVSLKVTNTANGKTYYGDGDTIEGFPCFYYISDWHSKLPTVPDGEYVLTPAFKVDGGEWTDALRHRDYNTSVTAKVQRSTYTFEAPKTGYPVVFNAEMPGDCKIDNYSRLSFHIRSGATDATLKFAVQSYSDDYTLIEQFGEQIVNIPANVEGALNFDFYPSADKYTEGSYFVRLGIIDNGAFNPISEYYRLTINANSSAPNNYILEVKWFDLLTPEIETDNPVVRCVPQVCCDDGTYSGFIYLHVAKKVGEVWERVAENSQFVNVPQWQWIGVDIECAVPSPHPGEIYRAEIYQDGPDGGLYSLYTTPEIGVKQVNKVGRLEVTDVHRTERASEASPIASFSYTITCHDAPYDDDILLCPMRFTPDWQIVWYDHVPARLTADRGQTVTVNFEWPIPDFTLGYYYFTLMQYDKEHETQTIDGSSVSVEIVEAEGIDDITTDRAGTRLYNLQGQPVDNANPAPGIYIRVTPQGSSKVIIR